MIMKMESTVLNMILGSLVFATLVMGQEDTTKKDRTKRFPNTKIVELVKSDLKGVFDESKYYPEKRTDRDRPNSHAIPEDKQDLDILASQLSWRHVDVLTGLQDEWVLEPQDMQAVLSAGARLGAEQAVGHVVEDQECDSEECEEGAGKKRRMIIFPPDERYEITNANWSPPRHVGYLRFPNGGHCTGTLIGPRHVLTAGHCVHEGNGGDWYGGLQFYPGRTSSNTPQPLQVVDLWAPDAWILDGDASHDFAVAFLSQETGLGWVSYGWNSGLSESWYFYSKGYPGDKPDGSQWSTSGYPSDVNDLSIEFKTLDTMPGQSGSPLYYYQSGGNPVIYGIHHGWQSWEFLWWSDIWNQATRITSARFSTLCDLINDARLGC